MLAEIIELIGTIIIILIGCELFANAVEQVGKKFALSHAAAGSLLAAVGTAMPETLIPVLALFFGGGHGEDISIGAILGAPFMLLTLAMLWIGLTLIILKFMKKREHAVLDIHVPAVIFDLKFFIIAFTLVIIGIFLYNKFNNKIIHWIIAVILFFLYIYYIKVTLSHKKGENETYEDVFYLQKYLSTRPTITYVYLQLILGLILIIFGSKLFIGYLTVLGPELGIPILVLSLLITPVATELPEKYNSITWLIKKRDTLAVANITGAVAFQSTIVVIIGLLFTEWNLDMHSILNIIFAYISGIILYLTLKFKGKLYGYSLVMVGLFYILYILLVFGIVKI